MIPAKGVGSILLSGALLWFGLADATGKDPPMSVGGLDRLLKIHAPKERSSGLDPPLRVFEKSLILIEGRPPVVIKIPGFDDRGCGACHQAEKLAAKTRDRLRRAVQSLETLLPQTRPVPLQQYILQTYTDRLLQAGQLAHATFRTIRTFPGTVIIDENIYGGQTHLHELLHLAQPFLGHVNELEAYGLNVLADPRFLLLNYPYFSNVVEAYFEPGLKAILQAWYARPVRQDVLVPREVQWYMVPFDTGSMDRLRQAAARLRPLLAEASRLYREHPYKTAYLSAQTGIRSLVLDIAAARLLDPPPLDLPEEKVRQAFVGYAKQITRDDNTRVGDVL
ncbi:MAG: hypothetical protein ACE5ER_10390, partial [Nitrospinaceae bacterium]